jgi:menaquinone-dependent protoporphyrinogen oxidase
VEIDESDLWRFSRRDILALSVSVITAMSFGGTLGVGISHAADIKFPERRCLGKTKRSVLVTYASKYGSTGGVADAIGKELFAKGVNADVVLIKNASNVRSYQGVVIGSAIYRGNWMSEAIDFVNENQDILCQMPVAYFLVCMTMSRPTEKNRAQVLSYMDDILKAVPKIQPVGIGTFAGALNYSNLSWLNKKILKSKGSPEGDFRDWNAIRAWAREPLYARFVQAGPKK